MNTAIVQIPGTETESQGFWIGLVKCTDWEEKYGAFDIKNYNQRMATWWRPDTDGRIRSWVQPYACLDVPEGAASKVDTSSYWLWECTAGAGVDGNQFTFSDTDYTIQSNYLSKCLVPGSTTSTWTDPNGMIFTVTPIRYAAACTDTEAKQWNIELMDAQIYPYSQYSYFSPPDEDTKGPHFAFEVYLRSMGGQGEGCSPGPGAWEPTATYQVLTDDVQGYENLASAYTPFSMDPECGFPVSVRVYYKWSNTPALFEPSAENGFRVMAINQASVGEVTAHPQSGSDSPYLEFTVSEPGQVTVLFTGAETSGNSNERIKNAKPHLALFIDPLEAPFADLLGCTRKTPCSSRSDDTGTVRTPFFVGPGFYDNHNFSTETCAYLSGLGTERDVDVHVAGGALLYCKLTADYGKENGPTVPASRVNLTGAGAFTGADDAVVNSAPMVLACADEVTIEGVTILDPTRREAGNLLANSPFECVGANADANESVWKHGNVDIRYAKQIGGHWWQADGFDVGSNSTITDSFIEANDDAIKMISNNQRFSNMTIWQHEIGWSVECGWGDGLPDHSNATASNVDIHLINHRYDKFCCSDRDRPAISCSSQTNEEAACIGSAGYPQAAADCDDPFGKEAVIGCLNGGGGTNSGPFYPSSNSNFTFERIFVRNPLTPAGTPYNRIQRIFAIGITTAPQGSYQVCPTGNNGEHPVELKNYRLKNIYAITPVPESSSERSRLYVNAPEASLTYALTDVYTDCSDPDPSKSTRVEMGCPESFIQPDSVCAPGSAEEHCYQVNGRFPQAVPEPAAWLQAAAVLFSIFAVRRFGLGVAEIPKARSRVS